MDVLLLGLAWNIFSALGMALDTLFTIFIAIAETTTKIINLESIMNNVYVLISVIMLFYITVYLLTYLVSPEKITDRTSGGIKLISKIVITLALLVFTPTIFSISRDLQTAILKENVIEKLILSTDEKYNEKLFESKAHDILEVLVKAFLQPRNGINEDDPMYSDPFFIARDKSLANLKVYAEDKNNYDFNWIMAILSLGLLCIIVFNFLFDISIRVIKLMFMELIAPIPILTYPFPSKNNLFSKWVNNTLMTYVSLFIRLLVIYFFLFFIQRLSEDTELLIDEPVIAAFLIIGALLFAKQLPQLIQDVFGIKLDGDFSFNPMSRIREVPLLGSAVQTAGAAAGGLVAGTAMGFRMAGAKAFRGVGTTFKEDGFGAGMKASFKALGSTALHGTAMGARLGGMGAVFGGRAGWNQTSWKGVAKKDQKVDKTAYSAGASAVAQAITGNDKATSGPIDKIFNNIGTGLNKPTFEQNKTIADAEKDYTKAQEKLSVLQDSQHEIDSNLGVAQAEYNGYASQIEVLQGQRDWVTSSEQQYQDAVANKEIRIKANETRLTGEIRQAEVDRDRVTARINKEYDSKITAVQAPERRAQMISDRHKNLDSIMANVEEKIRVTRETQGDAAAQQVYETEYKPYIEAKRNVEVTIDQKIQTEVQAIETQRNAEITSVQTQYNEQITTLTAERSQVRTTVNQEITELMQERNRARKEVDVKSVDRQISKLEEQAMPSKQRVEAYTAQKTDIDQQVRIQETKVSDAKAEVNAQKDILKNMHGPYKKNQ